MSLSFNANQYFEYANQYAQLNKASQDLRKQEGGLQRIIQSTENEYAELNRTLQDRSSTWTGWLVTLLAEKSGVLGRIHTTLQNISNNYKRETENYNSLSTRIKAVKSELDFCKRGEASIHSEIAKIASQNAALEHLYPNMRSRENVFKLMVSACGGQEKFDALPVLDLKLTRETTPDYIDSTVISLKNLTAPIMRFEDPHGRRGVVIRALVDDEKEPRMQTFFERYSQEATWVEGGHVLPMGAGYFINEGRVQEGPFRAVRDLLTNGQVSLEKDAIYPGSSAIDVRLV